MRDVFVAIVTFMGLLGIPTIFTLCVSCIRGYKKTCKKVDIVMVAIKSQMRAELLKEYHEHVARGFISEDDCLEWDNRYQAYHELVGENGILDARREALIKLPSVPDDGGVV